MPSPALWDVRSRSSRPHALAPTAEWYVANQPERGGEIEERLGDLGSMF